MLFLILFTRVRIYGVSDGPMTPHPCVRYLGSTFPNLLCRQRWYVSTSSKRSAQWLTIFIIKGYTPVSSVGGVLERRRWSWCSTEPRILISYSKAAVSFASLWMQLNLRIDRASRPAVRFKERMIVAALMRVMTVSRTVRKLCKRYGMWLG